MRTLEVTGRQEDPLEKVVYADHEDGVLLKAKADVLTVPVVCCDCGKVNRFEIRGDGGELSLRVIGDDDTTDRVRAISGLGDIKPSRAYDGLKAASLPEAETT